MKDKQYLYTMYNATSTDDGKGEIETYENWLERQLLSRIERIEALEKVNGQESEQRQFTIPDVSGWVSVEDKANPMPNIEGLQVMFESGTYMPYDAHPWPHEKVTHWRKKPCR